MLRRLNLTNKQTIKTKQPLGDFYVTQSRSQRHKGLQGKNPSPACGKLILRFLRINNQNYSQNNRRGKAYFQCTLYTQVVVWLFTLF